MLSPLARRFHTGDSTSSFTFQPSCKHSYAIAGKICLDHSVIFDIRYVYCWRSFVITSRHAFRQYLQLVPSISVLGRWAWYMMTMFITDGMYLSFLYFSYPGQSFLCVYPVWVHSQCGLETLIFFQLFRCKMLALKKRKLLAFQV